MAIHSSILAWEIPWADEPGRLTSMALWKSWTWLIDQTTTEKLTGLIDSFDVQNQFNWPMFAPIALGMSVWENKGKI